MNETQTGIRRVTQLAAAYVRNPLSSGYLSHSVRIPSSWQKLIAPLDAATVRLSRRDVFFKAEQTCSEETALIAFFTVMAWGYGDVGYGPFRAQRIVNEMGSEGECARFMLQLKDAAKDYVTGYRYLVNNEKKYLGPSFATKLLYFMSPEDNPAPILDSVVSRWLWKQGVLNGEKPFDSGWFDSGQYSSYVSFIDEARRAIHDELGLPGGIDRGFVEYLIFQDYTFSRAIAECPDWLRSVI